MVSPLLADRTLKRADLPGWMQREQIYDIDDAEGMAAASSMCSGARATSAACPTWRGI